MGLADSSYDQIQRQYMNIRLRHSELLENRKNEIYSKIEGFKAIDEQIIDVSMDYSRELMKIKKGTPEHKALSDRYHNRLLDIKMLKKKLLTENGYPYDYLDPSYDCAYCRDTGAIDGEKCVCYKQKESQLLYGACSISELLKTNNFSTLSREYYTGEDLVHFDKAVETCKNFIKNFNSDYRNLLFYGTVGTGKSFLSCCISKELIDRGLSVVYYSSNELFRSISTYTYSKEKEGLTNLMSTLYGCDLLVIDDLGTEFVNEFIRNQLFNIINERLLRQKSIIISTNLPLEGIRENYTDRVLSRMYESFELIKLSTARDIRLQKKLELKDN